MFTFLNLFILGKANSCWCKRRSQFLSFIKETNNENVRKITMFYQNRSIELEMLKEGALRVEIFIICHVMIPSQCYLELLLLN